MSSPMRKIALGGGLCILAASIAVLHYVSHGWTLLDAIYMAVITIFGVGYGEVQPIDSSELKIITMGLILVGCSSGVYFVGGFIQMLAEGEVRRLVGVHKSQRTAKKMQNHTIICGFGRIGQTLAEELTEAGKQFVIIDNEKSRAQRAEQKGYTALHGSASDESVLQQAGIERASCLASVVPNDAINVFITLTARDLNEHIEVIARAESKSTERKLLRSGATSVVQPAALGAIKIAEMIESSDLDRRQHPDSKIDKFIATLSGNKSHRPRNKNTEDAEQNSGAKMSNEKNVPVADSEEQSVLNAVDGIRDSLQQASQPTDEKPHVASTEASDD